jgi:hypothetical protein
MRWRSAAVGTGPVTWLMNGLGAGVEAPQEARLIHWIEAAIFKPLDLLRILFATILRTFM